MFIFDNFYVPYYLSTIGGEFQSLTGLYPNYSTLTKWKSGENSFPYGLANTFKEKGYKVKVELILSPAWTTDWITPKGRKALEEYGIASPLSESADKEALLGNKKVVKCPQCGSFNTKLVSQFGSTACKAFFQCEDCLEPFDYFKCLK